MTAFRTSLVAQHVFLLRVCGKLTQGRPHDLAQDVMLRALQWEDRFVCPPDRTLDVALRGWICTVARSVFLSQRRRDGRVLFDSDLTDGQLMYAGRMGSQDAHMRLLEAERLLLRLSPRMARALTLHALGYSYEEMAEMLSIPEGTVKSNVSRGLVRMRAMADGDGVTPSRAVKQVAQRHHGFPYAHHRTQAELQGEHT